MSVQKIHFHYKVRGSIENKKDTFYLSGHRGNDLKSLKNILKRLIPGCTYVHIKGKPKNVSEQRVKKVKQGGKYFEIPTGCGNLLLLTFLYYFLL